MKTSSRVLVALIGGAATAVLLGFRLIKVRAALDAHTLPNRLAPTPRPLSSADADLFLAIGVTSDTPAGAKFTAKPNIARLRLALARGANVNAVSLSQYTPIMIAAMQGDAYCAGELIDHNANVNSHGPSGVTALLLATQIGNIETMNVLIAHGADVNECENSGVTPLMRAVMIGNAAKVRTLITHHASVRTQDRMGRTALSWTTMLSPRSSKIEQVLKKAGGG